MKALSAWPFVQAKYYTPTNGRPIRVIVVHDMEAPEKGDTAETIARYFAEMPDNRKASAHLCVDNNSIVRCVNENDVAYAAPGCNRDGLHIELAGYGNQSRAQWEDQYGDDMLALAADAVAEWCHRYNIPPVHLTNDQLKAGQKGVVGHAQVSAVYKESDHADPGPNFPWDDFMPLVVHALASRIPGAA